MDATLENLKYPIGRFAWPKEVSREEIDRALQTIRSFPDRIRAAVENLDRGQLDTPYRAEGWTVRQVVHHVADSHLNAYIRFKLALTEDTPTIKPYDQARWAALPDSKMDPGVSLSLINHIHARWMIIMESMSDEDWQRSFIHPEQTRTMSLKQAVMLYAWHGDHHLSHVTTLAQRMNWV